LWASENGSQDLDGGAAPLIRSITLGYIEGRMTAYLNWPLVALPPGLPFETTGLIVADQPWSGAPYSDNFDSYPTSRQAKYLADEDGAFEVTGCGGGRGGNCLRQMAPQAPIYWHGHDGYPWTIVGDASWRNYTVSADVLFEQSGSSASLLGRYNARDYREIGHIDTYYLRVTDSGDWSIRKTPPTAR
jgi:hypothetical protein